MNVAPLIVDLLIGLGSVVLLLCAAGVLAMHDAVDQLHYLGPATTIAPLFIAVAIVIEEGFTSQAALKGLSVATAIVVASPIVSYATLRAIRTRETGAPDAVREAVVQR